MMMSILIKIVRVHGFRGLKDIEVELEQTTILTGMNNSGKTSFLKALQLALGNRQFLSQDDFHIQGNEISEKIVVDLLIIPVDEKGKQVENFSENWLDLFTEDRIRTDTSGTIPYVPLRIIITFDEVKNNYKIQQYILSGWPPFKTEALSWFQSDNGKEIPFRFEELPFFYVDAQRDILEDIRFKNSYLGKMLSKIEYEYEEQAKNEIEQNIEELNKTVVEQSNTLSTLKEILKELDTAMDHCSEGIEIAPFTKKLRDLNKGLSIYYRDRKDSFSMEYHGMGTRSWSSLLTLKSFISLLSKHAIENASLFFPILAIEEPEAHLHPNAQKTLYKQIHSIVGQKIISTHSPYIPMMAELDQIRSFYKTDTLLHCGKVETEQLESEDIRKIKRQVVHSRGEIFFSKLLVFFEGETEAQVLPRFAQRYLDKTPVEIGIDFIGVGGHGNYLPFLRFAEGLNIPWIIFSDHDKQGEVRKSVENQFKESESKKNKDDCLVFLDDGNDFERQLIHDGFQNEIKKAIISLKTYKNDKHEKAQKPRDEEEINSYTDEKLLGILKDNKTTLAPVIAEEIINSGKSLPPKVIELCEKIERCLNSKEENDVS